MWSTLTKLQANAISRQAPGQVHASCRPNLGKLQAMPGQSKQKVQAMCKQSPCELQGTPRQSQKRCPAISTQAVHAKSKQRNEQIHATSKQNSRQRPCQLYAKCRQNANSTQANIQCEMSCVFSQHRAGQLPFGRVTRSMYDVFCVTGRGPAGQSRSLGIWTSDLINVGWHYWCWPKASSTEQI